MTAPEDDENCNYAQSDQLVSEGQNPPHPQVR